MKPFITISLLLTLAGAPVHAAVIHGESFAEQIESGDNTLQLHRAALMRYLFFDVYVAGLYLPPGEAPEALFTSEGARRLEIAYLRSFTPEDFRRSTLAGIENNLPAAEFQRLRPQIEAMNALYRAVEPGDRYAVTYLPGIGTELAKNGKTLGVVPGLAFARAYLAIWFGSQPFDADLKQAILAPR